MKAKRTSSTRILRKEYNDDRLERLVKNGSAVATIKIITSKTTAMEQNRGPSIKDGKVILESIPFDIFRGGDYSGPKSFFYERGERMGFGGSYESRRFGFEKDGSFIVVAEQGDMREEWKVQLTDFKITEIERESHTVMGYTDRDDYTECWVANVMQDSVHKFLHVELGTLTGVLKTEVCADAAWCDAIAQIESSEGVVLRLHGSDGNVLHPTGKISPSACREDEEEEQLQRQAQPDADLKCSEGQSNGIAVRQASRKAGVPLRAPAKAKATARTASKSPAPKGTGYPASQASKAAPRSSSVASPRAKRNSSRSSSPAPKAKATVNAIK